MVAGSHGSCSQDSDQEARPGYYLPRLVPSEILPVARSHLLKASQLLKLVPTAGELASET